MGHSDGTLIDPTTFPLIDPEVVRSGGEKIGAIGTAFEAQISDLNSDWKRLRGPYQAPEQETVYALMDPAETDAETIKTKLLAVESHLNSFADALVPLKTRMDTLVHEAAAFRARVVNGVQTAGVYDEFGNEILPGEVVPWNEDWATNEENNHFHGRINELAADLSTAEADCADKINGLVEGMCMAPAQRVSKGDLNAAPADALPWGASGEFKGDNCGDSVALAVGDDFLLGTLEGLGSLILGYDAQTGEFFQGDAYGQAWGGLGNFAGSLLLYPIALPTSIYGLATGESNDFIDFMDDRTIVVGTVAGSLFNVDVTAENPFHKWQEDGVRAGVGTVLNIGSIIVPGANVATALKIGGRTGQVVNGIAATLDNILPGSSLLASTLATTFRFGDDVARLGDNVASLGDDIAGLGDNVAGLGDNVAGLGDNAAGLGDNAAGLGDNVAGLGDNAAGLGDNVGGLGDDISLSDDLFGDAGSLGDDVAGTTDDVASTTDDVAGTTDDVAGTTDDVAGTTDDAPPLTDDQGRPVPVDESGARVDAESGREVFVGRDGNLYYDDTGKRVPFADYPAAVPTPSTTFDVLAQRVPGEEFTPSQSYLDGAGADYADAVATHLENRATTDGLLDEFGLTRSDVADAGFGDELASLRDDLTQAGDFDRLEQLEALETALRDEVFSRAELRDPGEAAGLGAALDNQAANGMDTIISDATPGSGRVDAAAVQRTADGWNLVVDEAKGTQTSPSLGGRRLPDGTYVQQGTTEYLGDMFRVDDRIAQSLADYAADHPGFADAWNAGDVTIQYRLVTARPDGSVVIENFVIDRSMLSLPRIP